MFGFRKSKYYKGFSGIFVLLFVLTLICSYKKDEAHPITWNFWTNTAKTKIMKFAVDGECYDLFNYSNTKNNRYTVGEKLLTIFRNSQEKDTLRAEILSAKDGKLTLKYSDGYVENLFAANDKDCFIGDWIPTQQEINLDSFQINSNNRDCIKRDTSNTSKYFRYKFVNDSVAVFDYFELNKKDTVKYFVSTDKLMLMIINKDYSVSLRRK